MHGRKMVIWSSVLVGVLVISLRAQAGAQPQVHDPAAGVQSLLDQIEKGWDSHDLKMLQEQCYDENFLVIYAQEGARGISVLTRQGVLENIQKTWDKDTITSHRFVGRDIQIRGNFAWIRLTVSDHFRNKPAPLTRDVLALAFNQDGNWKMCFSMPSVFKPVLVISEVKPEMQGRQLGLQPGDIIVAYAGRTISQEDQLGHLIHLHSNEGGGKKLSLVVRRDSQEVRYDVSPGVLGVGIQMRLLPVRGSSLIDVDQQHPLKNAVTLEMELLKGRRLDQYCEQMSSPAFWTLSPDPPHPPRAMSPESARSWLEKALDLYCEKYDLSTMQMKDLRLILQGDLAVVSSLLQVMQQGDSPQLDSFPSALEIHIRQGDEWKLAAILPQRIEIGSTVRNTRVYQTPDQTAETKRRIAGKFSGIGAQIKSVPSGLFVERVLPGKSAEQAGIRGQETITAIDGQGAAGMATPAAVKLLLGPEGTTVELTILSAEGKTRTVTVTRGVIVVSGVESRMLTGKVGLLQVKDFNKETLEHARRAIVQLTNQGAAGLVLDLRDNLGGLYSEIVKFADLFVSSKKAMWFSKPLNGKPRAVRSQHQAFTRLPLVVLIGSRTKGGELVAAAILNSKRGKLIGQKSSGLTASRDMVENPDGSSEKVLLSEFFLNRKKPITGQGIEPDVQVSPTAGDQEWFDLAVKVLQEELR